MTNPNTPETREAILIMDSRRNVSSLRSGSLSSTWNKLYKVGDAYLDVSLKSEGETSLLVGQVISEKGVPSGHILLLDEDQQVKFAQGFESGAAFRFELNTADQYRLEMKIGEERFGISNLDLN
jgi:hypothetical protein